MTASINNIIIYAAVVISALSFGFYYDPKPSTSPLRIAKSFHRISNEIEKNLTIALGYNVCVDAIIRWNAVLDSEKIGLTTPGDNDFLHTPDDVFSTFAKYFTRGAAAERSCDAETFKVLVDKALAAHARTSLGGNAALMARKMATLAGDINILLNGHIGPDAAALLPPNVKIASQLSDRDEVHLILEYAENDVAGALKAPRANRFIITADESNLNAKEMINTIHAAIANNVDVLVVSGLHMMEPLPEQARTESILQIASALRAVNNTFTVHLELASSTRPEFMQLIAEQLFPLVDSIGFNEQEAVFLFESVGGTYGASTGVGSSAAVSSLDADARSIALLLRFILQQFPHVSRLHFHSLLYHVLAYNSSAVGGKWRGNSGAVAAGALTALSEACREDVRNIPDEQVYMRANLSLRTDALTDNEPRVYSLSSAAPVARFTWDNDALTFAVAPVAICKRPQSTVGLGDAISASGLAADAVRGGVAFEHQWINKWKLLRLLHTAYERARGFLKK